MSEKPVTLGMPVRPSRTSQREPSRRAPTSTGPTFSTRALRTGGLVRPIVGQLVPKRAVRIEIRRGPKVLRYVEIAVAEAPIIRRAIELSRCGRDGRHDAGVIHEDGYSILVWAIVRGGGGAVAFGSIAPDGSYLGRPTTLDASEVLGLARGLDWLTRQETP